MRPLICLAGAGCLAFLGGGTARAACGLEKVTQMPLLSLGRHYVVMVGLEDVTRPMEVDTGAATTLLKSSVAKELSLKVDEVAAHARPMIGFGQTSADFHLNVIPSELALGDLVFHDRSTFVATMDEGNVPEQASIGLLGDDILSQYDVEFDFPSHLLTFYRAIGCYDTFLPWLGPYAAIPFDHRNDKVTIDIMLNHERTRAIVDTGNDISFISKSAAALWGASMADITPIKASLRSPLNRGGAMPIGVYPFESVTIGGDVFPDMKMRVVDVDFSPASANLGLDYWSRRKVWISYPREWLFVAEDPARAKLAYPVNPAPAAPAPKPSPLAQAAGPN